MATVKKVGTGTPDVTYVYTDNLGSTNVTAKGDGSLRSAIDYYPFGAQRVCSGDCNVEKNYIGQYFDTDTSLNYLNARYYDSNMGRFISQDAMFWSPEKLLMDPQSMNSYSYARNNPIVSKDPSGKMFGIDDAFGFVIGGLSGMLLQQSIANISGQNLTWGDRAEAFVSGGVLGVGIVNVPETGGMSLLAAARLVAVPTLINGAAAGVAGNISKQLIDISTGQQKGGFNIGNLLISTVSTAILNFGLEAILPVAKIQGITQGKNSFSAIGKTIETKLSNGIIKNVSLRTELKSAIGSQTADTYKSIVGAIIDGIKLKITSNKE